MPPKAGARRGQRPPRCGLGIQRLRVSNSEVETREKRRHKHRRKQHCNGRTSQRALECAQPTRVRTCARDEKTTQKVLVHVCITLSVPCPQCWQASCCTSHAMQSTRCFLRWSRFSATSWGAAPMDLRSKGVAVFSRSLSRLGCSCAASLRRLAQPAGCHGRAAAESPEQKEGVRQLPRPASHALWREG